MSEKWSNTCVGSMTKFDCANEPIRPHWQTGRTDRHAVMTLGVLSHTELDELICEQLCCFSSVA